MSLRESVAEIATMLQSDLELVRGLPPIERVGPVYDELCAHYRIVAGCALLSEGDTDAYAGALACSAHVRHHLLTRHEEKPSLRNPYFAAGNSAGLFDALAASHIGLAAAIAELSPGEWWEGEEYAEDFYFAHFFHLLLRQPQGSHPDLASTLERLRAAFADDERARVGICTALMSRDQAGFDASFDKLLDERDTELVEEADRFWSDGKIGFRVMSRLHTEALAILNVADLRGLATEHEYRYCPALARMLGQPDFPPNPITG